MTTAASQARNFWTDAKCAKAFWGQHELPAYRRLLADTLDWAAPGPGESWLDVGCGGGALTRGLWERSGGRINGVVGVDCAETNQDKYRRLQLALTPERNERIQFLCHNFSVSGLGFFPQDSFDHAVSGLSISYAESFDEGSQTWTQTAYDRLLAEVLRVLRPRGRFVFSVNVPEPSWLKVGLRSLAGLFTARKPWNYVKKSGRMLRYGAWLKREARRGRFHYLPWQAVAGKLASAGFTDIEHRLSYAGQAFIFRATKPSHSP
jgi:ubiquinone/menaquinone biosynthesis C-methylase UbiE